MSSNSDGRDDRASIGELNCARGGGTPRLTAVDFVDFVTFASVFLTPSLPSACSAGVLRFLVFSAIPAGVDCSTSTSSWVS
jgi:hypothetical protein